MSIDLDRLTEILDACPIRKEWSEYRGMDGEVYLANSKDYLVIGADAWAKVPDGWREFIAHFDPELAEEMVARMRRQMSAARHTLDIYGVELHLATTEREWRNLRRRLSYVQDVPNSAGLTHFAIWNPNDGTKPTAVVSFWIRDAVTRNPLELTETCAHEATHATTHILGWTGHDIRGDDGNDEPSAYLTGWLTRWLYENTTPTKKGKR